MNEKMNTFLQQGGAEKEELTVIGNFTDKDQRSN